MVAGSGFCVCGLIVWRMNMTSHVPCPPPAVGPPFSMVKVCLPSSFFHPNFSAAAFQAISGIPNCLPMAE